ncbi:MAG: MoaD/ThiS family protein [Desulfobacterales bacterium]
MKIELVLFASFTDYMPAHAGGNPWLMEVEAGKTVGFLIEQLHLPADRPKMIFVNGLRVKEDALLSEGDRAGIFPLVAGG